jgi:OHCU decarboxylase
LLSQRPKEWLPIAGGTDVMVQFGAGVLPSRKLLNIRGLAELRGIEVLPEEIRIGAATTYTDLRRHPVIADEFPLLVSAASCTGGIANQNRGTLGGNIVNASPAADSLPPLLVYEAELIAVSIHQQRRIPYINFHTGYKQMDLGSDELIQYICLPRRYGQCTTYFRKVGARRAQAISKVCIAALAKIENGMIGDVRMALGSVAPVPVRAWQTEDLLRGKLVTQALIDEARKVIATEIRPISDIRSTVRYRSAVVSNLLAEFLVSLTRQAKGLSQVLMRWNQMSAEEAEREILACCGSRTWAREMSARRPIPSEAAVFELCDRVCSALSTDDWLEAFRRHPRIGETHSAHASERSSKWSSQEQSGSVLNENDKLALAEANRKYEERFGHIFIVCASGKTAGEILQILRKRMQNDAVTELREAAEQQRQITHLRLKKWLSE